MQAEFDDLRGFLGRQQGDPGIFGDLDGSRADLSDYIDVRDLRRSVYYRPERNRIRVVVGRKGSGKTLLLRHLALEIEKDPSLLLDGLPMRPVITHAEPTQLLKTSQVLRVGHWFPEAYLTEIWQQLWGRAIILAAASHLAMSPKFKVHVSKPEKTALLKDFSALLKGVKEPRTPFTAVKALIESAKSGNDLSDKLGWVLWDDMEARVASLLRKAPPLYFVIDAVDEDFAHAPAYWMRCQKGLFYEAMRMLRNSQLGSRLHVVASIRDTVFYSVFRSEHASRYIADPHIQALDWDFDAARSFLDTKIAKAWANGTIGSRERQISSLPDWLGFSSVLNESGHSEDVYAYVLRHTHCLPRDVVTFGNLLGRAMKVEEARGRPFDAVALSSVVRDVAIICGGTQLLVVANQVVADEIPAEATAYGFESAYLSVMEYQEDRMDKLVEIIRQCGTLTLNRDALLRLQEEGQRQFDAPDLASVLWQAGLLGVHETSGSAVRFFSYDRLGRMRIPQYAHLYVFHPSMRDVAGLAAT